MLPATSLMAGSTTSWATLLLHYLAVCIVTGAQEAQGPVCKPLVRGRSPGRGNFHRRLHLIVGCLNLQDFISPPKVPKPKPQYKTGGLPVCRVSSIECASPPCPWRRA